MYKCGGENSALCISTISSFSIFPLAPIYSPWFSKGLVYTIKLEGMEDDDLKWEILDISTSVPAEAHH